VNTVPCDYLGNPNDFANSPCAGLTPLPTGSAITFNDYTLDLTFASLPILTWGGEYTFTASSGLKVDTVVGGGESVAVYYAGTFSDSGTNYNATPASVTLSFEQDGGPTATVDFSGTFADPPESAPTPEPATLALLGSALIGLGTVRRRRA
jgi:hypothetical protein